MLRCVAQGWSEVTNPEPGQRALHAVHKPGAFLDQELALPIGPLSVLFGKRRHAHHAAMAPFPAQPPQEPALQQLGVEPVGLGPAMFARHGHTRGMDHVCLDPTRGKPARQPKAVAAGFEGQRNPCNIAAGFDRLIPPAMQHRKQPFWARLQLLTRLTLNAGKHTANQPARLAQFDDGDDRAIVVQGDEGPAQVARLGHRGTPSVRLQRRSCHVLAARPIESSGSAREWLPFRFVYLPETVRISSKGLADVKDRSFEATSLEQCCAWTSNARARYRRPAELDPQEKLTRCCGRTVVSIPPTDDARCSSNDRRGYARGVV